MVRRANKKSRMGENKKEKKLIIVAAEGENKTEKNYFNGFNGMQKKYRVIPAKGNNTNPMKIVQDAINSAKRECIDSAEGDSVFAVFDTDFGKETEIQEAIRYANKNNIEVILSNPCFEIWFLLHFRYSTKGYNSNAEVNSELRKYWPEYEKNIQSYEKVNNDYTKAIEHSKRIQAFNHSTYGTTEVIKCNSSTDVHLLVEKLMK